MKSGMDLDGIEKLQNRDVRINDAHRVDLHLVC